MFNPGIDSTCSLSDPNPGCKIAGPTKIESLSQAFKKECVFLIYALLFNTIYPLFVLVKHRYGFKVD